MKTHEIISISRVVISACLLILSGWLAVDSIGGWGWFLLTAILIFPNQVNIDFREGKK